MDGEAKSGGRLNPNEGCVKSYIETCDLATKVKIVITVQAQAKPNPSMGQGVEHEILT